MLKTAAEHWYVQESTVPLPLGVLALWHCLACQCKPVKHGGASVQDRLRTFLDMGKDRRDCLQRLCNNSGTLFPVICQILTLSWAPLIVKSLDDYSPFVKPTITALLNAANSPSCPPAFPIPSLNSSPSPSPSANPTQNYSFPPAVQGQAFAPFSGPATFWPSQGAPSATLTLLPGSGVLAQPQRDAPSNNPAIQLTYKATT